MKILSCDQIKELDSYTIKHEPVNSIDLMERASEQLFMWIAERYGNSAHFIVFAGPGNNGGDGLALARLLYLGGYKVDVHLIKISDKLSPDCEYNLKRLENVTNVTINHITGIEQFPVISSGEIVIDAIFGSGLTRNVDGFAAGVINLINKSDSTKISIDIPSGLFGEDNRTNLNTGIVSADYTLTFQFPKLAFMFSENSQYTGKWFVLPIGLDKNAIRNSRTPYCFLERSDILPLIKIRNQFDHKGIFGHGLFIAGSSGKMGAAVLGARAAVRSGIGLITCHIPAAGETIMQSSVPEAMVITDRSEKNVTQIGDTGSFSAVGIGPGLGTEKETTEALRTLLQFCKKPIVIDADAINIISSNKELFDLLPEGTVLTPHPKEFERLTGKTSNGLERLEKQLGFSMEHNCVVVYKGAYTTVTTPSGDVFFNSTGNPGMAAGGSGDVLTGIILSLLAQGYTPSNAAIAGVFIHGLAGDIAAGESCYESLIASDIINCIGKAFNTIRRNGATANGYLL